MRSRFALTGRTRRFPSRKRHGSAPKRAPTLANSRLSKSLNGRLIILTLRGLSFSPYATRRPLLSRSITTDSPVLRCFASTGGNVESFEPNVAVNLTRLPNSRELHDSIESLATGKLTPSRKAERPPPRSNFFIVMPMPTSGASSSILFSSRVPSHVTVLPPNCRANASGESPACMRSAKASTKTSQFCCQ